MRWLRWTVLLALVGLFGLLILGPTLLAISPLRDAVLKSQTDGLPIRIDCQRVWLAWWRPIHMSHVRIHDAHDQRLAEAASLQTEHTLWQLILNRDTIGTIHVDKPIVDIRLRADGSNLEDLFATLSSRPQSGSSIGGTIELRQALLQVEDEPRGKSWTLSAGHASLKLPSSDDETLTLKTDCVVSENDRQGQTKLEGRLYRSEHSEAWALHATVECVELPLAITQTILGRYWPGIEIDGTLTGQSSLDCSEETSAIGEMRIDELSLRAPSLKDDELNLRRADLSFDVTQSARHIEVARFDLKSSLADFKISGQVALEDKVAAWQSALHSGTFSTSGVLDIASLAKTLPRTMRLRDDVQLTDGQFDWNLSMQAAGNARTIKGKLLTTDVRAIQNKRTLDLGQPIDVGFQLQQTSRGWHVQELLGRSTFLAFSGRGDASQGQCAFRADLKKLHSEVGQILDLTQLRLAGQVDGQLRWHGEGNTIQTLGEMQGVNLAITMAPDKSWEQQQLKINLSADAKLEQFKLRELTSAEIRLQADGDKLTARLTQPMDSLNSHAPWRISVAGDLSSWRNRLSSLGTAELPQMSGKLQSTAKLNLSPDGVEVAESETVIDQFELATQGRRLREPRLTLNCVASWNRRTGQLASPSTTLATTSFAARASDVRMPTLPTPRIESGQISYRGDIERLWPYLRPRGPQTHRASGQIVGQLKVARSEAKTRFETANDMTELVWMERRQSNSTAPGGGPAASAWNRVWAEPRVRLTAHGTLADDLTRVDLDELQLQSDAAQLTVTGSVEDLTREIRLRLRGHSRLNLDVLSTRLRPIWGDQVRLYGSTSQPIMIEGPLRTGDAKMQMVSSGGESQGEWISSELKAEASVGWNRADAWGFQIDKGTLAAELRNQTLLILPTDLDVGGGRVHLAPRVRMTPRPTLVIAQGRVVDQVAITAEMCQGWLKYVAPLMANVTQAEGRFSLDVNSARVPATLPNLSEVEGALQVHSAQIGPSATTQQLLTLIQQLRAIAEPGSTGSSLATAWIDVPEQRVAFRMSQGRIEHENMTMIIGGVPVRTTGWVSLHQRMALVAEVPIQESWVGNNRWLAGLKGQSMRVPIRGTLRNPQLDQSVLGDLSRKAFTGAAEGALQDELQRQLNRLFK